MKLAILFILILVVLVGSYLFCFQVEWRTWMLDVEGGALYLNHNQPGENHLSVDLFPAYSRGVYEDDYGDRVRRWLPLRVLSSRSGWVVVASLWPFVALSAVGAAWSIRRRRARGRGFAVVPAA